MANSDLHDADPRAVALIGRAGGGIKGNQHLRYPAGHAARQPAADAGAARGRAAREVRPTAPARSRGVRCAIGASMLVACAAGCRARWPRRAATAAMQPPTPRRARWQHAAAVGGVRRRCRRGEAPARRRRRRRTRPTPTASTPCSWPPKPATPSHHPAAARGRRRCGIAQRRRPDRADERGAHRQCRGRAAAAEARRERQRRASSFGGQTAADVGRRAPPSGHGEAAGLEGRRRQCARHRAQFRAPHHRRSSATRTRTPAASRRCCTPSRENCKRLRRGAAAARAPT